MQRRTITLLSLVLCASWATGADANYFSNPRLNINYGLGSARRPTPKQVRENQMPQVQGVAITQKNDSTKQAVDQKVSSEKVASASPPR